MSAIAFKSGYTDSAVHAEGYSNDGGGGGNGPMSASSPVTISVWDGDWAILEEYDGSGSRVQGYVQGYHGLVKTLVDNVYYYQDELGSTSHIANSSGQLLEYYRYDVYGKPQFFDSTSQQLNSSTYGVKDLGTGGARWMPELGLYDDRNRFMSPDLGRFLQPDPVGFKADASNLYRYVGNDWANKSDPSGLGNNIDPSKNTAIPTFQEKLSAWEAQHQVSVDAHSVENHDYARNEASGGKLQQVSMNVTSIIRNGAQAGMKTSQTVDVSSNGSWSQSWSVGSTDFVGLKCPGIFPPPYASVTQKAGAPSTFNVTMRGYAVSVPLMARQAALGQGATGFITHSIHYSLHFTINFATHMLSMHGWHSSYPTFSASANSHEFYHHAEQFGLRGLYPGAETHPTREDANTQF